jgi:fructose-1,6-bisphosphatase/inositol monophosphatase family enzyme
MYQERIEFAINVVREAGRLTLGGFGKTGQIAKGGLDEYDISTEYDLRTEELLTSRIQREFGEPVLGEENGLIGEHETAKHKLWIVDPIDGTFNYQRGVPLYGVTIAYCEDEIPVCGTIFLPALGQLFSAEKGQGAFLMEQGASAPLSIHVADSAQDVSKLVMAVAGKDAYKLMAAFAGQRIPRRSMRYFMCAVVCLAYVASGRMDAYLHSGLCLWDCAAGDLILREAGGPPLMDHGGVPIFPEYLNRFLTLDDTDRFPMVAASSHELIQDPIKRLLAAANLPGKDVS